MLKATHLREELFIFDESKTVGRPAFRAFRISFRFPHLTPRKGVLAKTLDCPDSGGKSR